MGGSLAKVFGSTDGLDPEGKPLGANATADQLGLSGPQLAARKGISGALSAFGNGMQQHPNAGSGGGGMQAPAATPVDPRFFTPSNFGPPGSPGGNSAFYGQ